MESFHYLPTRESGVISNSVSSKESHHPLRECFMADASGEHNERARNEEAMPTDGAVAGTVEGAQGHVAPAQVGAHPTRARD